MKTWFTVLAVSALPLLGGAGRCMSPEPEAPNGARDFLQRAREQASAAKSPEAAPVPPTRSGPDGDSGRLTQDETDRLMAVATYVKRNGLAEYANAGRHLQIGFKFVHELHVVFARPHGNPIDEIETIELGGGAAFASLRRDGDPYCVVGPFIVVHPDGRLGASVYKEWSHETVGSLTDPAMQARFRRELAFWLAEFKVPSAAGAKTQLTPDELATLRLLLKGAATVSRSGAFGRRHELRLKADQTIVLFYRTAELPTADWSTSRAITIHPDGSIDPQVLSGDEDWVTGRSDTVADDVQKDLKDELRFWTRTAKTSE